jgi:hypothetical protein
MQSYMVCIYKCIYTYVYVYISIFILTLYVLKLTYINFCRNDDLHEVYSMLLEKAYAKLHGIYIDYMSIYVYVYIYICI